jgi:hypothetical protein
LRTEKEFPLAEKSQHGVTRLIIQRHGVLRGWGAGLNNLHLECIRLWGFIFQIYFILLQLMSVFRIGTESYQGGWKWRSGFWESGWMVETSMQKRWRPVTYDFGFFFFFACLLLFRVVVVYRTCVIIRSAMLLCGIRKGFLSLFFIYFRVL